MALYYEKLPSDAELEAQPLKPLAIAKTAFRRSPERGLALRSDGLSNRLKIVIVCVSYALVGPSLVMINNRILKQLNFPYPLILSSIGLVTTSIVCSVILRVGSFITARDGGDGGMFQTPTSPASEQVEGRGFEPHTWQLPTVNFRFWLWNMVPIGAAQGLTFFGTNAAYMYLTITFTQMLAAFTPTVTLLLLYLTGAMS